MSEAAGNENENENENENDETYILLVLSDSNLPTGSFVASSGLESYTTHGFLSLSAPASTPATTSKTRTDGTLAFVRDSLHTYAHSALPFVSDSHGVVTPLSSSPSPDVYNASIDGALASLISLDALYESMTLNHVARRASTAQGVALLTLYTKAFSMPSASTSDPRPESLSVGSLVDKLKLAIRRGETLGHLPLCWGVLTGALGLSLVRAQYLALFLHARSLLSAAVRMNTIGPYLAQQILLRDVRGIVDGLVSQCGNLRTGISITTECEETSPIVHHDHGAACLEPEVDRDELGYLNGPATTWPLGEILAIRHDLQHSRMFNS
ncbi:urease accessory protein UreF [Gyrodon lividus]|nr:urease accessory protein UreF [Gyrodon lividus]